MLQDVTALIKDSGEILAAFVYELPGYLSLTLSAQAEKRLTFASIVCVQVKKCSLNL